MGFPLIVVFLSGWFKRWSWRSLYVPFYGWRDKDLGDEGLRHRKLAIEGVFGFVGSILIVFLFVLLGELVGLNLFSG